MNRTVTLFLFICGIVLGNVNAAQVADLSRGTVRLLEGYTQSRTGTKDSDMGEIVRADKKLVIHYDIGKMAGYRVHPSHKSEFQWYQEQIINDRKVCFGLKNKELGITIYDHYYSKEETGVEPVNFWAIVNKPEEAAEVLLTVGSYEAKTRGR
jgi:hypothetical protein